MKQILLILTGVLLLNSAYAQVKAMSSETSTGVDDDKYVTPLALQGSKYIDQYGLKISATATGINTYAATISPSITAYNSGQIFYIKITTSNTGACTLNLNSLGAKIMVKDVNTPLNSGDLLAGKVYAVYYDGVNFQVLNVGQKLSLGSLAGNIALSGGNNISINSLSRASIISDANSGISYGFYPYANITGSSNFPSATGAGVRMIRADSSAYGYFEFNRPVESTDLLYYRVGTGNTTFSPWQTIASREWATSKFQSAFIVANNKLLGRYAAAPGLGQDVTIGAGLTLNSAGTLYSGSESGASGPGTKIVKVSNPAGGQFKGAGTVAGVIKIQLPSNDAIMYSIRGTLHQFEGAVPENRTTSFLITCFASGMDNGYSATFTGNYAPNYPVRWYTNGTTPAIYIGDLTNTWNYVTVTIDEVQASYRSPTYDIVSAGWSVSLETAFTGTLAATQLYTLPSSNLNQRLAGFAAGTNTTLTNTDNIIGAFGKIQGQLNSRLSFSATQPAGTVLSAPETTTGSPTFRFLTKADIRRAFGADATSGILDWNDVTNTMPGFSPTLLRGNATNGFESGSYYHPFTIMYAGKEGVGNLTQMAYPYTPGLADGIFYRTRYSDVYTPWRKVWDSVNFTNLSQLTTRNFSDLQNKPVTLSGYGITDAATQAYVTTIDANAVHKTGNETITGTKLFNTSVGIGTSNILSYKLAVGGGIIAESIKVKPQSGWADYVFEKDYPMLSLGELERFVLENKRLPDVPTAAEVSKDGIDLGDMNTKLLRKIEELTLYLIEKNKQIEMLTERTRGADKLSKTVEELSRQVRKMSLKKHVKQ